MSRAGPKADREPNDFYPTPAWCVRRFFEAWTPPAGTILEPCAGKGAIVEAASALSNNWLCFEIEPQYTFPLNTLLIESERLLGYKIGDCLNRPRCNSVRSIITNPPYLKAVEIILYHIKTYPGIPVAMLLRMGFLESEVRKAFWQEAGHPDLYVLPNRPSFTNGKTDSATYAWFVWPGDYQSSGKVTILNYTSKTERGVR